MRYEPQRCSCCGQSITYLLAVDRGTVDILKAIATAIRKKGVNAIHPRKEMETTQKLDYDLMVLEGLLTSNQVGNLSKPRFHGLIARIKGSPGNYCLTKKGAEFLHGVEIPRFAEISKATGHQVGYWREAQDRVTIKQFTPDREYWEGINYEIREGEVIIVPSQIKQIKIESRQKTLI